VAASRRTAANLSDDKTITTLQLTTARVRPCVDTSWHMLQPAGRLHGAMGPVAAWPADHPFQCSSVLSPVFLLLLVLLLHMGLATCCAAT